MKTSLYFLIPLYLGLLISCQEKPVGPDAMLPPTGCDGDLTGTDCQQFFVPEGETLSYPTGTEIKASKGIEINGDIVIDPSAGGDFTITAISGDIVIAGKILVKDTASGNSSGGRYKTGKSGARIKNGKAADGFNLILNARGPNGNIILRKGATLFSGRGQYAPDETLTSLSGYYEGAGGGNGGLIMLNAPNGKVKLPNVGSGVTEFQDEVFVLGNGGNGANIDLAETLETGNLDAVEVRGGLGGNAGQLIIDADEIEGIPTLEAMETHPDFIYGGEGGIGGYVFWIVAGNQKKYTLQEIILNGGDGGDGAIVGGDGGFAYFTSGPTMSEVGDPVANVFCYGGEGGHVFASPLPLKEVKGGDGGEYVANGVRGWDGGEDKDGNLIRDGANGGNALGQGGTGGDVLAGVSAYKATGGSGGNSELARIFLPNLIVIADDLIFLSSAYGVVGGNGGNGYDDCGGCRGGDGGNIGTATALGGNGGNILGTAIQSFGGQGGDNWAVLYGNPGIGGDGNPPGEGGTSPAGIVLTAYPGDGGNGTTKGRPGKTLLLDEETGVHSFDGKACGEEATCEEEDMHPPTGGENCREEGASFLYETTETTQHPNGKSETIVTIKGAYIEDGCDGSPCFICDRTRTQTRTFTDGREPTSSSTTGTGPCQYMNIDPFCTTDGQLFYPAGNSSVSYSYYDTQVTVTFGGCYGDEQAPRTCCQKNGNYYFWGDDNCPE